MQLAMAIALVGGRQYRLSLRRRSLHAGIRICSACFSSLAFFVTGLVNSWNMLDGVDGLAGGRQVSR